MAQPYRGDRLALLREERGLKQYQAAIDLGLSQSYMSMLERGKVESPGIDHLRRLAQFYDVNLDYILGKTADRRPYERRDRSTELEADEQAILEIYRQLPEASRPHAQDLLQAMVDAVRAHDGAL